jgi:creatinine amidohydrolase
MTASSSGPGNPSPASPCAVTEAPGQAGHDGGPRAHILHEANYAQLLARRPNVAVLPWGATEAHNWHMPHGTDVVEAVSLAERAADLAVAAGARVIVLPAIPYGNNAQQQDQVATVHFSTATALAILRDVTDSLARQGIDRLVIVNGHGGNDFKPMVRDCQLTSGLTILVVDFWRLCPDVLTATFPDPGDHAGQLETSLLLHLRPEWMEMERAGKGEAAARLPEGIRQANAWTPRPWSKVQPDTGSGDPAGSSAALGARYFEAAAASLATLLTTVSGLDRGVDVFG